MNNVTKRILSLVLALLLLTPGLVSLTAYAGSEATAIEGETFAVDKTYTTTRALDKTPHTFEATIHLPKSYSDNTRPGVIFGNFSNNSTPSLSFELETPKKIRLYYNTGKKANSIYFNYDVRSDGYVTIAVTLDPETNKAILYVNGEFVSEQTTTAVTTFCSVLPTNRFMVGGDLRTQSLNQQYFKGVIKSVSVYGDTRTGEEVASDYAKGADTSDSELLCAYDLTSKDPSVRVQDLSANKNNLIFSYPEWDNEMLAEGLYFTAQNTYRVTKAFPSESPLVTIEAEIFLPAGVTGRGGTIFGNYSMGKWSTNVEIYESGKPRLYFENNGGTAYNFVFDEVDVRLDKWVDLAIVMDAERGIVYCYLDGELKQTIDNGAPLSLDYAEIYKSSFYLGRDTRSDVYFKGSIKSLAAYTDQRTAEEIASDAQRVDLADESLACAYYFNESTGRNDISGNGYHIYYTGEEIVKPDEGGTDNNDPDEGGTDNNDPDVGGSDNDEPASSEGLTFDADTYAIVTKSLWGNMPLTFEATIILPESVTGRAGVIFGNYIDNSHKYLSFEILENGHPRLTFHNVGLSMTRDYRFNKVKVNTGEPVHLAIAIDPVNDVLLCYVNGVLAETQLSNPVTYDANITTEYHFIVGNDLRAASASQYFKGTICNVSLYSDMRTAEEIKADCKKADLEDINLILSYDLSSVKKGEDVPDLSGNGYTLSFGDKVKAQVNHWIDRETPSDFLYSLALVGDTQIINRLYPDSFATIYDWILENQSALNIQYVFGLGDITDGNSVGEWERARNILRLNGVVPYSVVRGNHDGVDRFNSLFVNDQAYMSQFDGFFEENDARNSYRKITIGDTKMLMITLDYGASDEVLEWAGAIIEANKDCKVIISTHAYLYRDGTTLDQNDVCPPATSGGYNNGDHMWDKLISQHENIILVLSGHDPSAQVVMSQKTGVHGNVVTQLLVDHQGVDKTEPTGMVTMLYFKADGSIEVQTYSTIQEKYYRDSNQFVIDEFFHAFGEYETYVYENGYLQAGKLIALCKNCGLESVTNVKPLFEFKGYSLNEASTGAICVGYVINLDLIELYGEMTGKEFEFGLVAAPYAIVPEEGKPIKPDGTADEPTNGRIVSYPLIDTTRHVNFILTADDWSALADLPIILCAYFITDGEVYYACQKDVATTTAGYITYNSILSN